MTTTHVATAIVREPSAALARCELTFMGREPIDLALAARQHRAYVEALTRSGLRAVVLPADPGLPDSVFVEDVAVVLDEVAVTTIPGAPSRRPEVPAVAEVLARYRPVEFMQGPGTLDGGDVMRVGRTLYVGLGSRTSAEGAAELAAIVGRHGYSVITVPVTGSLHLKTAVSHVGRGTVLANREWFDASRIVGLEVVDVDPAEPWAANSVLTGPTVLLAATAPRTRDRLVAVGFAVESVDISELQKAEAGLSCLSVVVGASHG